MPNNAGITALERLLRPLSRQMTAELARALANIEADEEMQARYEQLAGRRTEGSLTPDETAELESLVRANTLPGVLKAEAHLFLRQSPAA